MRGKFKDAIAASAEAPGTPAPVRSVAAPEGESAALSTKAEPPPKAIRLPPKRKDGWPKPVIVNVKTYRAEQ
jgi:hypothetical protein